MLTWRQSWLYAVVGLQSCAGVPAPGSYSSKSEVASVEEADGLLADWRLAPNDELERSTISLSHILVRHMEAEPSQAPLLGADWRVLGPPPQRSRTEAAELAEALRNEALSDPGRFGELAARASEDSVTATLGGRLGTVSVLDLTSWPSVIDSLSELAEGQVSRVVESPWGYHVFHLNRPLVGAVSVRQLVIGHRNAEWLRFSSRTQSMESWRQRTHEEALLQASKLAKELAKDPERFGLMLTESDHFSADEDGYAGTWTSLEPSVYRGALDEVWRLPVGGVSRPLDTCIGFVIWLRVPVREDEPRYASSTIRFSYSQSEGTTSKVEVRKVAEQALGDMLSGQAGYERYVARYGETIDVFTAGKGRRGEEVLMRELPVGATGRAIVDSDGAYTILRKLDPEREPTLPRYRLGIPRPAMPSLNFSLAYTDPEFRKSLLESCALERMSAASVPNAGEFVALADKLGNALRAPNSVRKRRLLVAEFLNEVEYQFGTAASYSLRKCIANGLRKELLR